MYHTSEFRKFRNSYQRALLPHQGKMTDLMIDNDVLTVCMPTGTGKSRIIYADILERLQDPSFDTFVVASHRLLLNIQHLNELFETFRPVLSTIGFIFIGSYQIDLDEFVINKESNHLLSKLQMNYRDIVASETNEDRINYLVNNHKANGRDVIIITTYHSLDKLKNINIHTIYCDEAHFLASENEMALFKTNFEQIHSERKYFFTATPKDLIEDTEDKFFMNNENIFGKREGISFKESLDESLIVKPWAHIMEIRDMKFTKNYLSIENYIRIILEGFKQHKIEIQKHSKLPEKCAPKILIKCPSVEIMWKIREKLIEKTNVKVFCGASWSPDNYNYYENENGFSSKISFLKRLQNLSDDDEALILHYDILSEGIDVPGITGVMFLSNSLPTKAKILQTIGRSTRLHREDRRKIGEGRLAKCDYDNYIKPYCWVILPILNQEMGFSVDEIAKMLKELRDNYGFELAMMTELGEDISKGKKDNEIEGLNEIGSSKALFSKIEEIIHKIEDLDTEEIELNLENEIKEAKNFKKENRTEYIKKFVEALRN